MLPLIQGLKAEHPFWGYRRIWAFLRFARKIRINQKRVDRLLRENDLLCKKNHFFKAKRENKTSKPRPEKPNSWWGIEMTKVSTAEGWVYVVIVNGWFTKRYEIENLELNLMSDNGSQPTSVNFMRRVGSLDIRQTFTAYANPKGNADTERVIRTIKEELVWLREWSSVEELACAAPEFVISFNENYLHSALGYNRRTSLKNDGLRKTKTLSLRQLD